MLKQIINKYVLKAVLIISSMLIPISCGGIPQERLDIVSHNLEKSQGKVQELERELDVMRLRVQNLRKELENTFEQLSNSEIELEALRTTKKEIETKLAAGSIAAKEAGKDASKLRSNMNEAIQIIELINDLARSGQSSTVSDPLVLMNRLNDLKDEEIRDLFDQIMKVQSDEEAGLIIQLMYDRILEILDEN